MASYYETYTANEMFKHFYMLKELKQTGRKEKEW